MSMCTAPVTGRHKDAVTQAKCPACSPRRAHAATSVASLPPVADKPKAFETRITDVLGVREKLGRDLSPGETSRLLAAVGLREDEHSEADILRSVAMHTALVFYSDEDTPAASLNATLRWGLPALPDWLGDADALWQVVYAEAEHEVDAHTLVVLDDGEPDSIDPSECEEFERAIALKPYSSLRNAIVDKTEVDVRNKGAINYLLNVGEDALIDPTHAEVALTLHRNPPKADS